MRDDVNHQIERAQRLELLVAERIREMQAQRRVLVHHDGEPRSACRLGLDNQGVLSMNQEIVCTAPAVTGAFEDANNVGAERSTISARAGVPHASGNVRLTNRYSYVHI